MHRYYLIFGLFSGLSSLILQFLYYNGNFPLEKGGIVNILILVLLAICVIFSAVAYKKEQKRVSFMRVIFGGFLVALIATIPSVIWYNTTYLINEDFFTPVKEYQLENKMRMIEEHDKVNQNQDKLSSPMTKKEKAEMLEKIEIGAKPGWFTIMYLIMNLVIGIVVSAFTAGFIASKSDMHQG
jgi:hypothetical protein